MLNATILDCKTPLDTILYPPNPIHAIFIKILLSLTLCMLLSVFKIFLLKSDMISLIAVDNILKSLFLLYQSQYFNIIYKLF